MILTATATEAESRRVPRQLSGGGTGWTSVFFGAAPTRSTDGAPDPEVGEPQAFLVEQNPGSTVAPHFHFEDQYQLVVRGAGTLGRHPLRAVSLHYANGHTGYGPIVAGENGLAYLTLRERGDQGAWYLPAERSRMRGSARRYQFTAGPVAPLAPEETRSIAVARVEPLFAADESAGAWTVSLGPRDAVPRELCELEAGRFLVVIAGAVVVNNLKLAPLSVAYFSAGEHEQITAGDEGAQFLMLRFRLQTSKTDATVAESATPRA